MRTRSRSTPAPTRSRWPTPATCTSGGCGRPTKLPEGKIIIPGLLGHANNYVEHPDLIAEYIVKYADLVGKENVIAGADCGFSSRASYAPEVHPTIVWPKFEALAAGAAIASKELWG